MRRAAKHLVEWYDERRRDFDEVYRLRLGTAARN
jgi:hypothetical protein